VVGARGRRCAAVSEVDQQIVAREQPRRDRHRQALLSLVRRFIDLGLQLQPAEWVEVQRGPFLDLVPGPPWPA
jgi:hypothetical protein